MSYDLRTMYDSRASFYGKARVEENNGDLELISYATRVAIIYADGHARVFGTYSQTTLRHIKEFLLQNNFRADNAKQIMADYGQDNDIKPDDGADHLKTVSTVMALGDIFGSTQAERNDWKARMLKAGLDGRGLIMPDDWDQLDEDTKTRRLDAVIETLQLK